MYIYLYIFIYINIYLYKEMQGEESRIIDRCRQCRQTNAKQRNSEA